jgi:hypothetical protein
MKTHSKHRNGGRKLVREEIASDEMPENGMFCAA